MGNIVMYAVLIALASASYWSAPSFVHSMAPFFLWMVVILGIVTGIAASAMQKNDADKFHALSKKVEKARKFSIPVARLGMFILIGVVASTERYWLASSLVVSALFAESVYSRVATHVRPAPPRTEPEP